MSSLPPPSDHFQGKNVIEHLREARGKGAMAAREVHGTEISGHLAAGADATKETAIALFLFCLILFSLKIDGLTIEKALWIFFAGWFIWKIGRSAILGWSRLERLHRLIEEERYEIEHNRAQEKEELQELYAAKGFSGKLLDQVIDTLMSDDNRLLKIMLEEELGLTLESFEHPLKQAVGAGVGVIFAFLLSLGGLYFGGKVGLCLGTAVALFSATLLTAKSERNRPLNILLWTFAAAALTSGVALFVFKRLF
jgi:vacuolar iron transporter family protein